MAPRVSFWLAGCLLLAYSGLFQANFVDRDVQKEATIAEVMNTLKEMQFKIHELERKQLEQEETKYNSNACDPMAQIEHKRHKRSGRYGRNASQDNCREGRPGRDGRDGRDGQPGPVGPPGKDAFSMSQLEEVLERVLDFKNAIQSQFAGTKGNNTGGAVYVRWGRTVCPQHSELIYNGYAAGAHYTHPGGGSNKICLSSTPQWNRTRPGFQSGGHVYGAEYQVSGFNPFSTDNTRGHTLHDANVVCAVCLAVSRFTHVMIPANTDCPPGWKKEYNGYLTSEHQTHKRSSYECMDIAPEVSNSGAGDQNGALFYISEAACGSLSCPPYIQGYELTCVVCTR